MEKEEHGVIKGRTLLGLGLLAMLVALFALLGSFDLDEFFTHSDPTPTQQERHPKAPDGQRREDDRAPFMEPSATAVAERETLDLLPEIAEPEKEVPPPFAAPPLQATERVVISNPAGPPRDLGAPTAASGAHIFDPPPEGAKEVEPAMAEEEYPYSVLLATFRSRKKAERALRIYARQGLETYYVKVNLGRKGVRYRVFAGSFKDREEALALVREKNLQQVATKKTSYACLIDKSATEQALDPKIASLKRLGHSPYVVNKDDGRYYLYVGAFYTEQGATSQLTELSSQRIRSQVVER